MRIENNNDSYSKSRTKEKPKISSFLYQSKKTQFEQLITSFQQQLESNEAFFWLEQLLKSQENELESEQIKERLELTEISRDQIEKLCKLKREIRELEEQFKEEIGTQELIISDTCKKNPQETKNQSELMEIDYNDNNRTTIHSGFILPSQLISSWQTLNFTPDLISQWGSEGFSTSQTQDWLNIGLSPSDFSLVSWLRNSKNLTPEDVLNQGNLEQLNQEFFAWWQKRQFQTQQEQPPK